jgi:methionyl aminopeptidase
MPICLKSEGEIDAMAAAGLAVAYALDAMKLLARPGVKLTELEELALETLKKHGAKPSLLGYQPSFSAFPYEFATCLSLNDEVIHGLPRQTILKPGDLLGMDLVGNVDGWHADSTVTILIPPGKPKAKKLQEVTREAMWIGIRKCVPGATLGDVGYAIQSFVERNGFNVVRELSGHGIGRQVHEPGLDVHNFGAPGEGVRLEPGMTFAVEPMVASGAGKVKHFPGDPWTIATADGSLGAHFEHTVAVTEDGPRVLTLLPKSVRAGAAA